MEGTVIVRVKKGLFKRKQGFAFSMWSWMTMSEYTKLPLNEFEALGDRFISVAYYCAALAYNYLNGIKVKFTERDVKGWIDNMTTVEAKQIYDALINSRIGGEKIADLIDDDGEKKKFGQMTSKITPSEHSE